MSQRKERKVRLRGQPKAVTVNTKEQLMLDIRAVAGLINPEIAAKLNLKK